MDGLGPASRPCRRELERVECRRLPREADVPRPSFSQGAGHSRRRLQATSASRGYRQGSPLQRENDHLGGLQCPNRRTRNASQPSAVG